MIFIVESGEPEEDLNLEHGVFWLQRMKNPQMKRRLAFFGQNQSRRRQMTRSQDSGRPLADLAIDETLYVVGHTEIKGSEMHLSGKSAAELAGILVSRGFNVLKPHMLILVACRSGKKLKPPTKSYAEQLWDALVQRINSIDRHNAFKTHRLPQIKAPKTIVQYNQAGHCVVIPEEKYEAYCEVRDATDPQQLALFVGKHARQAQPGDFSYINVLQKSAIPAEKYNPHANSDIKNLL